LASFQTEFHIPQNHRGGKCLIQVSICSIIEKAVDEVMAANPKEVAR
jgi:hypothetical protein